MTVAIGFNGEKYLRHICDVSSVVEALGNIYIFTFMGRTEVFDKYNIRELRIEMEKRQE